MTLFDFSLSEIMYDKLKNAGVPSKLIRIEDGGTRNPVCPKDAEKSERTLCWLDGPIFEGKTKTA